MRRTLALLTCLIALIATSCSQFPGTENAAPPRTDALIDAMSNGVIFQADSLTQDSGEAECIAKGVFGVIGATRLNEAGVTITSADLSAADLTTSERASVMQVVTDCTGALPLSDDSVEGTPASIASAGASENAGSTNAGSIAATTSSGETQAQLVEYMVTDLMSDPNTPTTSRSDARCMIEGTIALLGLDAAGVEEMAYDDRDPTRHEYNAMVEAYSRCVDVIPDFAAGLDASGFYPAEASCIARQFGRDNIVQMMKNNYGLDENADPTPAGEALLFSAMDQCGIE